MSKHFQGVMGALFFLILAANTMWRPFDTWRVQSGPLNILQSVVDALLVSWLGSPIAAAVLMLLAIAFPITLFSSRNAAPADVSHRNTRPVRPHASQSKPSRLGGR